MRRADVLGIMAAQMIGGRRCEKGEEYEFFKSYVHAADALLREAERVSPEPSEAIWRGIEQARRGEGEMWPGPSTDPGFSNT